MAASTTSSLATLESSVNALLLSSASKKLSFSANQFSELTGEHAFATALDIVLPVLRDTTAESFCRVTAAYLLFALYKEFDANMNPFWQPMRDVVESEPEASAVNAEGVAAVLQTILDGRAKELSDRTPQELLNIVPNSSIDLLDEPVAPRSSAASPQRRIERTVLRTVTERTLTLHEQSTLISSLDHLPDSPILAEDVPIVAHLNPQLLSSLFSHVAKTSPSSVTLQPYLEALQTLPPSLSTFDNIVKLASDPTLIGSLGASTRTLEKRPSSLPAPTVGTLVRHEVLGPFIANSLAHLGRIEEAREDDADGREMRLSDREARAERAGDRDGDRGEDVGRMVQLLCIFFNALLTKGIIDEASDVETIEISHFALTHSRYPEASELYRRLAQGNEFVSTTIV